MSTILAPSVQSNSPPFETSSWQPSLALAALNKELAERHLAEYIKQAWHILEPQTPLVWGWYADAICEHLEAVSAGDITELLITVPPRFAKSLFISVFWPSWDWIAAPHLRWMYSSYGQDLSVRDSVKCRRLIRSPWYQSRWGDRFQILKDQATRFENDRSGFRFATMVDGMNTGEGGDRIVCLPGDRLLETTHGPLSLGAIVDGRLPVQVLGATPEGQLRWQQITSYECAPGRPLLEITTRTRTLICTEDHPVYTVESGFLPAKEVDYSHHLLGVSDGNLHLLRMQQAVRSGTRSCSPIEDGTLLFSGLLRSIREGAAQSFLDWWKYQSHMQALWRTFSNQAQSDLSVLFRSLCREMEKTATHEGMRCLSDCLSPGQWSAALLFSDVCQQSPSDNDTGRFQRPLQDGQMGNEVCTWIHKGFSESNYGQGWKRLFRLFKYVSPSGTSLRWNERQSCTRQSDYALSQLSQSYPPEPSLSACLADTDAVVSLRSLPAGQRVYNIRTAPDHTYFADGLLVHNCDDPHNVKEAESKTVREGTVRWWHETMSTRINDPNTAARVVIQQRVHSKDLAGDLISKGSYIHLNLPMEYELDNRCVVDFGRRDGSRFYWEDPRHEEKELLCPARFNRAQTDKLKIDLGLYAAAAQLQQRPSPRGGGMFKRHWFHIADEPPVEMAKQLRWWDLAGTDPTDTSGDPDYTVGAFVGVDIRKRLWVLDIQRDRLSPGGVEGLIRVTAGIDGRSIPQYFEQEPGQSGKTQIFSLQRYVIPGSRVKGVPSDAKKEQYADVITGHAEVGNITLIRSPRWNEDFLSEFETFPNGPHDDIVDAVCKGFARLLNRKPGIIAL